MRKLPTKKRFIDMTLSTLARKYRPETFEHLRGQEPIARSLSNAIKRQQVPQAMIFAGIRGVGKTSTARILARSLNCKNGPTTRPCMQCQNCMEITRGVSLAVAEIDGASHNSVDNVRSLIETLRTSPPPESAYKIYIIDEVHMLSTAAFNALLKSIEEPPEKVIFMLATTELHKIPDTVVSRCMVFEFRALDIEVIEGRLRDICSEEEITYEEEALAMIARLAEGSMRDAETLLDRLRRFSVETLTEDDAAEVFGAVQKKALYQISYAVIHKNPANILYVIDKVFKGGCDPMNFLKSIVTLFRELLVLKLGDGAIGARFGIRCEDEEIMRNQLASIEAEELQQIVQGIRKDADNACRSNYLRYALEASLVRYAMREQGPGGSRIEGARGAGAKEVDDKVRESKEAANKSSSEKSNVREHPTVKSVLEAFPGSSIAIQGTNK